MTCTTTAKKYSNVCWSWRLLPSRHSNHSVANVHDTCRNSDRTDGHQDLQAVRFGVQPDAAKLEWKWFHTRRPPTTILQLLDQPQKNQTHSKPNLCLLRHAITNFPLAFSLDGCTNAPKFLKLGPDFVLLLSDFLRRFGCFSSPSSEVRWSRINTSGLSSCTFPSIIEWWLMPSFTCRGRLKGTKYKWGCQGG